jgi:hypothetical protein
MSSLSSPIATCVAIFMAACLAAPAHAQRYNPYAVPEQPLAPVAPDGTIQWGTFFKSAQLQKSYERLWNLGACRGTNKAITVPVESNKLLIDRLPEAEYRGVVQGANGTIAGGVVAFAENAAAAGHDDAYFAQLHPAGVSRLSVNGQAAASIVRPGMTVRLLANVDGRGRCAEPVRSFDIVTPPADFKPDEVRPGRIDRIVGVVTQVRGDTMLVRVDAGKIRRLSFTLADDAVATLDAANLELVAPGDEIEVRGRLWSGEGSTGAGTIFVSQVTVTKPPLAKRPASGQTVAGAGQPAPPAVE